MSSLQRRRSAPQCPEAGRCIPVYQTFQRNVANSLAAALRRRRLPLRRLRPQINVTPPGCVFIQQVDSCTRQRLVHIKVIHSGPPRSITTIPELIRVEPFQETRPRKSFPRFLGASVSSRPRQQLSICTGVCVCERVSVYVCEFDSLMAPLPCVRVLFLFEFVCAVLFAAVCVCVCVCVCV